MKFGVREICDVVLRAKAAQKVGNKIFYKNEPVLYFDTLKTSSLEGASTTVYAQGGRGNSRLMAWEGERTVTFTMEDALISPEGFMILSGAGLVEAAKGATIKQHVTETIDASEVTVTEEGLEIELSNVPYVGAQTDGDFIFVMLVKDGEIISEPFIPDHALLREIDDDGNVTSKQIKTITIHNGSVFNHLWNEDCNLTATNCTSGYKVKNYVTAAVDGETHKEECEFHPKAESGKSLANLAFDSVIVDYYVEHESGAMQIEITPDKFGGNYYLEASTLFRNEKGQDMPAEFIIPNCKIQSNFTFSMASSGDPSTFTFTMDAFPDYTRFDHSKKVLAAIQVIQDSGNNREIFRHSTVHEEAHDELAWD